MADIAATAGTSDSVAQGESDERPVVFHDLTFHDEGDELTVGRLDEGTFVALPADGGALLRQLVDGQTPGKAAEWYLATYGEPIDVTDFINDLDELGFLRKPGETLRSAAPLRWTRLGAAVFSPVACVIYVALLVSAIVAMVRSPVLVPMYRNLFFTHYLSVMMVALFITQFPLILLHEASHALAGRRLGLPSSLSVGRRLYYLVFETSMDGLVAQPRGKRVLPIVSGILTDFGVLAALTLGAAATMRPDGTFPLPGGLLLAMAYMTLLRVLWQFSFFLQTDIYYLVVTVLGCVDLHTCAKQMLSNRWRALLGRSPRYDPADWHPRDRKVARWYSALIVTGYAVVLATLAIAVVPILIRLLAMVIGRLAGDGAQGTAGVADSIVFLVLSIGEIVVALAFSLRDRRRNAESARLAG